MGEHQRRARLTALGPAGLLLLALAGCDRSVPPDARFQTVPQADARRGQALLARHQCGACHVIPEVPGAAGRSGPTLEHFGRRSYIAGAVPNTPELLQRWLQDPPALVPGTAMPAMGVSPEAARDMAAYLMALR
ncbi:c-type cytochrome [Azohydromonas caseinilytica]|uniref:c-type cytochrome n=1 Tax=Azohydromonas caseinilytica TaxID=2728836 RepID=UPI0028733729|nr:c-type cytochrome [Azohydromonas caseinilytica]